mmetsp:Transcript_45036/g.54133  ORF Transcript_45036/g.54133 Transcript_45036/m.54133 type:complete len:237 (-) Transcript_45036:237-947(-)
MGVVAVVVTVVKLTEEPCFGVCGSFWCRQVVALAGLMFVFLTTYTHGNGLKERNLRFPLFHNFGFATSGQTSPFVLCHETNLTFDFVAIISTTCRLGRRNKVIMNPGKPWVLIHVVKEEWKRKVRFVTIQTTICSSSHIECSGGPIVVFGRLSEDTERRLICFRIHPKFLISIMVGLFLWNGLRWNPGYFRSVWEKMVLRVRLRYGATTNKSSTNIIDQTPDAQPSSYLEESNHHR